ncbi:hypothetical protein RhiirA1_456279 [Rhizophagus irregularis]|uniref:Uncharacterized protein n=1 Tax=Rhizophagus irregularis TaxID=588596 RepID=A0A2N0S0W9_9GLOM|nr:hypothetical protein RhiirA1_456279 [Rhizophagus irregularis]
MTLDLFSKVSTSVFGFELVSAFDYWLWIGRHRLRFLILDRYRQIFRLLIVSVPGFGLVSASVLGSKVLFVKF